jgi:hypothetical protein
MSLKTWSNAWPKGGCILGVNDTDLFLITVPGRSVQDALDSIQSELATGTDLQDFINVELLVVPLADVDHLVINFENVEAYYRVAGSSKTKLLSYTSKSEADSPAIAAEIAESTGRPYRESLEDKTLWEAAGFELILTGVSAFLSIIVYGVAVEVATGKQVVAHGTRQGLKNLAIDVATLLGVNGSMAAGLVITGLCLAWMLKNAIYRPKVMKLIFAPAN